MIIFVADYLPLANKGEEEILRGIEELFKQKGNDNISFSVFGDVLSTNKQGNVTVFPKDLLYKYSSNGTINTLSGLYWAFLGFIGHNPYKKILHKQELINAFEQSDLILIGHDGFFNIRSAILADYLFKKGIKYGILGAGFNRPGRKIAWLYDKVYKRCFDNAQYVVLREKTAYEYVKQLSNNSVIKLYPDPAFFCPGDAFNKTNVDSIITKYGIDNKEALSIGMTICEESISFSHAFVNSNNKVEEHRDFISKLMLEISKKTKCVFYFLPHCIKEGEGNDLLIAKDIKKRLHKSIECRIIDEDMPVLDLKYLISKMDLMIGERTHSIINSISTATPFVSLTCSLDFRTHNIVGDMCGLPQQVYDMDYPDMTKLLRIAENTINNNMTLRDSLNNICFKNKSLKKEIQEIICI